MGYLMLKNRLSDRGYEKTSLEGAALNFVRNSCEGLRFDENKATRWDADNQDRKGTSLKAGQIPYNMEKDIDRLCLENALDRFLKSGKKQDAFDVYFCYLEMFVGDYEKTRRMIELLSEYEANGSGLLMKHRDHYSHSVYVFALGLAIYESNEIFRKAYRDHYQRKGENEAACHFLKYWGLTSLFHDIGYPFELPFEQVESYFEVEGNARENKPFMSYHAMDSFVRVDRRTREKVRAVLGEVDFITTDEIFAHVLADKMGEAYHFDEKKMCAILKKKPTAPNEYSFFMDHAYFSATVLFQKLFGEMNCDLRKEHLDALTAILMHNSLYKFSIAKYKGPDNVPCKPELHPLAYMLMLCDELQCWDRTAYGRNSRKELHPMGCEFELSGNQIRACYQYDEKEKAKIERFKDDYINWVNKPGKPEQKGKAPTLKAYSGMCIHQRGGKSDFQSDIEKIVDLTQIELRVETRLVESPRNRQREYLSDSNFINLYHFALVLNGRWGNVDDWKTSKDMGREEQFLGNNDLIREFSDSFKALSLEYKLSNINQAKAFAKYLGEVKCFYTDRDVAFDQVESFSQEELLKIGVLEHQRWLQEHYDMGWEYGNPEKKDRDYLRQHMDMIPDFDGDSREITLQEAKANYERLDKAEQDKDTEPMECMLAMLRMFDGLRIYRL